MKKFLIPALSLLILFSISCKKNKDYIHTVFTVNGTQMKFENSDYFSTNLCGASTWCGHFYKEPLTTVKNYMKFGIPGDPVVGRIYTLGEEKGCKVVYRDPYDKEYSFPSTAPMTFSFIRWEGPGGWAEGTFSGWLKSFEGDSVQILDGYFENMISSGK
jgi:hypothetical protein